MRRAGRDRTRGKRVARGSRLIVAAETLNTRTVFTIDRRDFATYRMRRGHRYYPAEILG